MDALEVDALLVALVGGTVVAVALARAVSARLGIPALVAYLALGFALRLADTSVGLLTPQVHEAFRLLANLGIVVLLFEVGLRSHPAALAAKLPAASLVWLGNVAVSGLAGFGASRWLLGLDLVPSLVVGTALTATSVGVCVSAWDDAGALDTPDGELLVDVAELDDISAVGLVGLLFAVAPALVVGNTDLAGPVGEAALAFAMRLAALVAACLAFARFLERRVTGMALRLAHPPEQMLVVAGVGFLISALAAHLGFSLAVGAMLAGIVFSTDPQAVRTDAALRDLGAFVTPFFFVSTGMGIDPGALPGALGLGGVLLAAAVLGKVVGTSLPALLVTSRQGALLLGVSMIPRAEIAMVVLDQARVGLPEVVGPDLYAAMVLVTAITCLLAPLLLARLLPQGGLAEAA